MPDTADASPFVPAGARSTTALAAEIAVVRPQLVVCLGATAVRSVLGPQVRVTRDRGAVLESEHPPGRFLITIHPSAVLRGQDRRDELFAGLVNDLGVAAAAVR